MSLKISAFRKLSLRARRGIFPLSLLIVLLLLFLFAPPTSAQVTTGTPAFGSYGGGTDVINLANLNSHLTIPVLHKPGRGTPFTYDLTYDSSIWYPVGVSGSQVWTANTNTWGWQILGQFTGGVTHSTQGSVCTINGHNYHGITIFNNWHYIDRFGISHAFPGQDYLYTAPCGSGTTGLQAMASDGSGYKLVAQGGYGSVVSSSGTNLSSTLVTDRNGNEISVNSNGTFTDTLGTTVLATAGSAPNPITFTYTAPSGANATYTVNYTTYPIQTNFGCNGITDYGTNGTTTASLISEIDLPDGSKYTFAYEPTPGHSTFVTGRLASVTLPTGGMISYSYSGGSSGHITCADGSAATLTRTTPDTGANSWTYSHSESGTVWTTLVTDPQGNQTNLNFQGIYETERQVYQGSATLLKTIWTCYNGNTAPCNNTGVGVPITQRTVLQQYGTSGLECKHNYTYNSNGGLTEQDDYDYGPSAPGPLLRKILIGYASLSNNITAFKQTVTVCSGTGSSPACNNAGTLLAQTTYNYDEPGTLTTTSGIAQHTSVTGSRGNLTSINYPVSGLTSHFTYYDTGSPNTSQDVNSGTTTYTFDTSGGHTADCQMAFPIGMTEAITTLKRSYTWNCTGGVQLTAVDENNQTVTTNYTDPDFWRPASAVDQASHTLNFSYYNPVPARSEAYMFFNSGNSIAEKLTTFDGLGRVSVTQRQQAPGVSNFDTVETDYDSLGRPSRTTVPYFSNSYGQTNANAPATTTTYDALGRANVVTDGGQGTVTYSYSNNDVLVTVGPQVTGEHLKQRQLEYDSLDRLTSVCELTTLSGSGNCGQNTSQTGYWTKYSYDALGNLLQVTQNAQAASGSQQTRNYSYDAMSRLTSETNPETGTTSYTYDSIASGTCAGTFDGDLIKRVDAIGNTTCYSYDLLHRPLSRTYTVTNPTVATPNKCFVYDAVIDSQTAVNTKARLAEAYTTTSACSQTTLPSSITDEALSYTSRGELADVYELTPHSSPTYYHVTQSYWANGSPNVLGGTGNNIGLPTSITYGADGEGRTNTVSASSGSNPVTATAYNLYTSPYQLSVTFGSGDSDVFTYDPNTFRLSKYQFNIGSSTVTGTLGWNSNGSLGSLNISDPFSTANTQNCSFTADDLARISQVSCGTIWGQNFTYDSFGNIQKQAISGTGGSSFAPTYASSPITNRIASVGGTNAIYDANGNSTNDTFRSFTWDAENHPVTIGSSLTLAYDALQRVVEQSVSGANSEVVYSPAGDKLALMNGSTLTKAFVPLPGGATAVYNSSGLAYFRHTDHLGSSRLASTATQTQTPYSETAYSPFGEPYASSGAIDPSFTGQNQDATAGLYDFRFREYDPNQARWTRPDPAGLAAVSSANPQSWNRYAYVLNNPLGAVDPVGYECVWDDGSYDSEGDPITGSVSGCQEAGGTWIELGQDGGWSAYGDQNIADVVAGIQDGQYGAVTAIGLNGSVYVTGYNATGQATWTDYNGWVNYYSYDIADPLNAHLQGGYADPNGIYADALRNWQVNQFFYNMSSDEQALWHLSEFFNGPLMTPEEGCTVAAWGGLLGAVALDPAVAPYLLLEGGPGAAIASRGGIGLAVAGVGCDMLAHTSEPTN